MSPEIARVIFWIAVVSCVVAQVALLRAVVSIGGATYPDDRRKGPRRGGLRSGPDRRSGSPEHAGASGRETEIAWAILPALGLVALLVATWLALPV